MSKFPPPPELTVLDGAINVYMGGCHYTCIALRAAACRFGARPSPLVPTTYTRQYELWCRAQNRGHLPYWWNSSQSFRWQRLSALRGFRQACIDAATKEK